MTWLTSGRSAEDAFYIGFAVAGALNFLLYVVFGVIERLTEGG